MSASVSGPGDIYDAAGELRIAGASIPGGQPGDVVTCDEDGNLSLQPPPAAAASPSAILTERVFSA